jgi:hypothetical protein
MGGKSDDTQTVTQVQKLPPQISSALDFLVGSTMGLANQYGVGRNGINTSGGQLGGMPGGVNAFNFDGGVQQQADPVSTLPPVRSLPIAPNTPVMSGFRQPIRGNIAEGFDDPFIPSQYSPLSGGKSGGGMGGGFSGFLPGLGRGQAQSIVPDLSQDTLSGLAALRGAYDNNPGVAELNRTVNGEYTNPYGDQTATVGVNTAAGLTNNVNPMNNQVYRNNLAALGNTFANQTAATALNPYADVSNNNVGAMNNYAGFANDAAQGVNNAAALRNAAQTMNQYAGLSNNVAGVLNPLLGSNDLSGLTDAISHAARKSVADRFAESGRAGSGNEGISLGETVTRQLAPYVFQANESDLQRRFNAGESLVNRLNNAEESRLSRLNSAGENAVDRVFGAEESRIARMTGVDESRLDRMTAAERDRINNLIAADENRIGRDFAAEESRISRLNAAGEALRGREFTANQDRINNEIAAEEGRINRQVASEQDYLSRLQDAREAATQRAFGSEESRLGRMNNAMESQLARELAAQESALARGFSSYEAERARQLAAVQPLLNLPIQNAQNLLNAGQIVDEFNQRKAMEPFQLMSMIQNPLVAAIGGAPISSTTSQPLNRNVGAGIIGGGATGLGLGALTAAKGATGLAALGGPLGIGLGLGGALLGGLL